MTRKNTRMLHAALCVLPVLLILVVIRAYPIFDSIAKSFTSWDGLGAARWIGLANYQSIFNDNEFWVSFTNCLILLLHIPIKMLLALVFAVLLYEGVAGWRVFRSIMFFPQVISAAIIGFLFSILFSYYGPVNQVLEMINPSMEPIEWLGSRGTGMLVIIICLIWQGIGYQALLLTGGIMAIPESLFEAARLEGANYWQRLFHIVLPMVIRVVEYLFITNVSWVFTGIFSYVYAITNGGPGYSTSTVDFMIYTKAFVQGNDYGIPCALSVIMLFIVLGFAIIQSMATDKADDWSGSS